MSEMETRKSKCHREMSMSELCIVHCLRDRVTDDLHFINEVYSENRQEVGWSGKTAGFWGLGKTVRLWRAPSVWRQSRHLNITSSLWRLHIICTIIYISSSFKLTDIPSKAVRIRLSDTWQTDTWQLAKHTDITSLVSLTDIHKDWQMLNDQSVWTAHHGQPGKH